MVELLNFVEETTRKNLVGFWVGVKRHMHGMCAGTEVLKKIDLKIDDSFSI
ncbi:MAG: hypothetical protein ACK44D_04080 [Bacteroidia bacterium]